MTTESLVAEYQLLRPRYEALATNVAWILRSFHHPLDAIHKIEHRAKTLESFRAKCGKTLSDGVTPKYSSPLSQVTDLAGVRVIVFTPRAVRHVCDFISENFQVSEQRDVGEERFADGHFGYQSIHFLTTMKPERLALPEFHGHADLVCEIQVRTILQHAWAEMEHDIQYKSEHDIPKALERKFLALAGMLEIADREFQSIQDEDAKLKSTVQSSLEEQLTRNAIAESEQLPEPGGEGIDFGAPARARDFVTLGKFSEAIGLYDRMIELQPQSYTLYIGRARARFLEGDQRGALEDLDRAELIKPDDSAIRSLRAQISEGTVSQFPALSAYIAASEKVRAGDEALSRGAAEEAYVLYSEAQALGYNFAFCAFNKAMACVLARDTAGARISIASLRPIPGTPMSVNMGLINCIIAVLEGNDPEPETAILRVILDRMPDYDYQLSHLRYLEDGFGTKDYDDKGRLLSLFDAVRSTSPS